MADYFDYDAAKKAGMTPAAINQFLQDQLAEGHAYDLPPTAYGELRAVRTAQGGGHNAYQGSDQPGDMSPGLIDPVELPGMLLNPPGARALAGTGAALGAAGSAIKGGLQSVAQGAGGPLARGAGGAALEAGLEFLPAPLRIAARGAMSAFGRKEAAPVAEAVGKEVVPAAQAVAEKVIPKGKTLVSEHLRTLPKKSGPPRPKLKVVKPKPKGPPGTSQAAKASRHEVQYFSASRGEHVDIEGMNQKHIEHAIRRLTASKPKPGSVASKQLDALLAESKHRALTTGIHIGQAEGKAAADLPIQGLDPASIAKSAKIQSWMDAQGLDPATQAQLWAQYRAEGGMP
jgi:hypothetical protein